MQMTPLCLLCGCTCHFPNLAAQTYTHRGIADVQKQLHAVVFSVLRAQDTRLSCRHNTLSCCACLQDAVVIEYAFHLGDSHLHGFAMQLLDDLSVPASFIGIAPSSKDFIIPKVEASNLSYNLRRQRTASALAHAHMLG